MKIAVCSTSRNRPRGLVGLSHAIFSSISQQNEVKHFIRLDDDDAKSRKVVDLLHPSSVPVLGPRTATLGQSWNAAIEAAYDQMPDWEAMTFFPDDVLPMTLWWDLGIPQLIDGHGLHNSAWTDQADISQLEYFILSRRYVDALGGKIFTEFFPFWFDDTWISEIHHLAFGSPVQTIESMRIGGNAGPTTGMRDLEFWVRFWISTRSIRIDKARQLRREMGAPEIDITPILEQFAQIDRLWWDGRMERIEKERGETKPPDIRYLAAKAKATAWLKNNPQPSIGDVGVRRTENRNFCHAFNHA